MREAILLMIFLVFALLLGMRHGGPEMFIRNIYVMAMVSGLIGFGFSVMAQKTLNILIKQLSIPFASISLIGYVLICTYPRLASDFIQVSIFTLPFLDFYTLTHAF
jgi:hypothetical protein